MGHANPLVGGQQQLYAVGNGAGVADGTRADRVVIDGTPVRVVVIALAAAASITALRWAGFRFNVGVSN